MATTSSVSNHITVHNSDIFFDVCSQVCTYLRDNPLIGELKCDYYGTPLRAGYTYILLNIEEFKKLSQIAKKAGFKVPNFIDSPRGPHFKIFDKKEIESEYREETAEYLQSLSSEIKLEVVRVKIQRDIAWSKGIYDLVVLEVKREWFDAIRYDLWLDPSEENYQIIIGIKESSNHSQEEALLTLEKNDIDDAISRLSDKIFDLFKQKPIIGTINFRNEIDHVVGLDLEIKAEHFTKLNPLIESEGFIPSEVDESASQYFKIISRREIKGRTIYSKKDEKLIKLIPIKFKHNINASRKPWTSEVAVCFDSTPFNTIRKSIGLKPLKEDHSIVLGTRKWVDYIKTDFPFSDYDVAEFQTTPEVAPERSIDTHPTKESIINLIFKTIQDQIVDFNGVLLTNGYFIYLKVNDVFIQHTLIQGLLNQLGYSLPPFFNRIDSVGAHISLISPKDFVTYKNKIHPTKLGKQHSFKPLKFEKANPPNWKGVFEILLLKVEAPELQELRVKYGLPQTFPFHITLGIKRVKKDKADEVTLNIPLKTLSSGIDEDKFIKFAYINPFRYQLNYINNGILYFPGLCISSSSLINFNNFIKSFGYELLSTTTQHIKVFSDIPHHNPFNKNINFERLQEKFDQEIAFPAQYSITKDTKTGEHFFVICVNQFFLKEFVMNLFGMNPFENRSFQLAFRKIG